MSPWTMSAVAPSPSLLQPSDHHRAIPYVSASLPVHRFCRSRLSWCNVRRRWSTSSSSSSAPEPHGNSTREVNHVEDSQNLSSSSIGPGKLGDQPEKAKPSDDLMQKLKRYGVAGVLSYGLLNTIYYLATFLVVWFYVAPAPARLGYAAAVERFVKIMAMVWAGSQVTKLLRAGGALALAPLVDKGLSWFTIKFKFESKGKAFGAVAGLCLGLALLVFFVLTLLWA